MSQTYAGGIITANQNSNFSGLFSGSNSFLSFPGAAQYAIANSTTPFTIEAWVKPYTAGGLILSELFEGGAINIACALATSNDVSSPSGLFPAFGWYTGSAWVTAAASTTPIVLNTWTHIAFVFTGSTSRVYINGVNVTRASSPTPQTTWGITASSGTTWYIGRRWDTGGNNVYFDGLINNFRFVNGTAVYTSNFTVPTNLTAITNTVMLTCQGSTFVDASSYAATITNNNGVIVSTDNPFYTQSSPALGAATPGVWTLSQANQAAGQRSWPMYDPFFNLATSMIHGNGTNGATNNTFLDSSSNNFSVTRNGNATQGTFTPFSEPNGYWSSFNGNTSTGYLTVVGNSNLALSTGDFTIECLFYLTALPNPNCMLYDARPASTDGAYPCLFVAVTTNVLTYYVSTAARITGTRPLTVGQWYHVVVSRVSGNTRMFLNGAQDGSTYVDSTNYLNGTNRPLIGNNGLNLNGFVFGYISNVRVRKGTNSGTTAPTVPTAPLPLTEDTQLLTCQNNRYIDNSLNAYTITRNGDARTLAYSPFYSPTAYTPQAKGGAMYFDGVGDYLTVADNASLELGASDFCIEFLMYTTAVATDAILITKRASSAAYAPILIYRNSAAIRVGMSSNGSSWNMVDPTTTTLGNVTTNQWFHISVYRVGTAIYGSLNGTITTLNANTSASALNNTDPYYIGSDSNLSPYVGFLSDMRIVIGSSVYTSGSAPYPTAPLTAITNTQLLLNGTNAAVFDNATNATAETNVASISTAQNKYGSGSMSFNGSSTYISLTSPFGNGSNVVQTLGDFTVEAWVNPTSIGTQQCLFCINGNTSSYAGCRLDINTTGGLQLLVSTNGTTHAINSSSTYAIPTGAWMHIAVVRQGPAYIVYLNGSPVITSTAIGITTAVIAGTISSLGALFNTAWATFFNGYMIDFRATNYARYLGVFTPPTSTLQNQ
jgi:hypothetical protein